MVVKVRVYSVQRKSIHVVLLKEALVNESVSMIALFLLITSDTFGDLAVHSGMAVVHLHWVITMDLYRVLI